VCACVWVRACMSVSACVRVCVRVWVLCAGVLVCVVGRCLEGVGLESGQISDGH